MASVQKAAEQPAKERSHADIVRIKAGHMLTFDYLASHSDVTERQTARSVVRKSIQRSTSCLALPLTIAYFGFFITSVRLHEDITNVFFLESTLRERLDAMFMDAHTAADVWGALTDPQPGNFADLFFNNKDMYGGTQVRNVTEDVWGDWGLVLGYNQIEGAVQLKQWRRGRADFGAAYNCSSAVTCDLCRSNEGLQTIDNTFMRAPIPRECGSWDGTRRLRDGAAGAAAERAHPGAADDFHPRRLHMGRPELRSSFPATAGLEVNDTFRFWLYPSESTAEALERLNYFKDRRWIDEHTERVEIRLYLMNAELGRNRLEQLTVTLLFSEAGSVYYERDIQCYFLQFFYGNLSMLADGMFFIMLVLNTAYRLHAMWKAFLNSKLFVHLLNLYTGWEWVMILAGWWVLYGYYKMLFFWEPELLDALKPVHQRGWTIGPDRIGEVENLFDKGQKAADGLASMRVIVAQYSILLMFRFFVSFGSQPRLAIVLNTMQKVLTDLLHFLVVFVPTAFAYVIAGSLIFGRRIEGFTTITASLGTCFRIAMESEYEWEEMSAEFFGAAALWAWSFLLLVVLLFLNLVLAIILDIYNETRESSFPGEAVWETVGHFLIKGYMFRSWVPDRALEAKLAETAGQGMLDTQALEEEFPKIPAAQKNHFFRACRAEMRWESAKDLQKTTLLKVVGSVMEAVDTAHATVDKAVTVDAKDPVASWVKPLATAEEESQHNFLKHIATKGGRQPTVEEGAKVEFCNQGAPEWLQEVWELLAEQRRWIEHTNWSLQQMQWQIQQAVESRQPEACA